MTSAQVRYAFRFNEFAVCPSVSSRLWVVGSGAAGALVKQTFRAEFPRTFRWPPLSMRNAWPSNWYWSDPLHCKLGHYLIAHIQINKTNSLVCIVYLCDDTAQAFLVYGQRAAIGKMMEGKWRTAPSRRSCTVMRGRLLVCHFTVASSICAQ